MKKGDSFWRKTSLNSNKNYFKRRNCIKNQYNSSFIKRTQIKSYFSKSSDFTWYFQTNQSDWQSKSKSKAESNWIL